MKGSTFKRCGCRDEAGRPVKECPNLSRSGHGSWFYRIDTGPDPLTGKRREKRKGGFPNKRDAERALSELTQRINGGEYRDDQRLTVGDWLTAWIDRKEANGLRASTAATYRRHITVWLVPRLGRIRLGALRHEHVERLVSDLVAEGVGVVTIHRVRATLRSALSGARRARLITINPASDIDMPKVSTAKVNPWTPEEWLRFAAVAKGHRLGPLFDFMARTGLRRGEALGLCWGDVNEAGRSLTVRTALVRAGGRVVENNPKTRAGEARRVALASDTLDLLAVQRFGQDIERHEFGDAYREGPNGGRVFAQPDGADLDPGVVTYVFRALVAKAGLRPQRLHDLRHLSASFDALAGVDIATTSKRLGHSHPSFTAAVYSHLYDAAAQQAAEAAAALFRAPDGAPA